MFAVILWVVGAIIAIVVGLVSHLIPVIYQVCVFGQRHLVLLLERLTGRVFTVSGLTVGSLVVWGALGALGGTLLLSPSWGIWAPLGVGVLAASWGGSVGYQVGMANLVFIYRQPGVLSDQRPGSVQRGRTATKTPWGGVPADWLSENTVLGESGQQDERVGR